jgi:hypothetical protein
MTTVRAVLLSSAIIAGLAAIVQFAPVTSARLPEIPEPAEAALAATAFHTLAGRFDARALPDRRAPEQVGEAPPPPPPPDPALSLKRYRFIGLAISDARSAGVFERDGATLVLAPGAALEGFTLTAVGAAGAQFTNEDDREVSLSLATPVAQ